VSIDRYSRGALLRRAGVAAAAGAGLSRAPAALAAATEEPGGGFGRMFSLPPFARPTPRLERALLELGKRGGLLDADDDLTLGPEALFEERYILVDEDFYRFADDHTNPSKHGSAAGLTFLAQFVAHDLTFDATSTAGLPADARRTPNARTPAFDLDSVYGGGPTLAPHLFDERNPAKLRVERAGRHEDVPRTAGGSALVADPRNDQTSILCGLHAAFLLFHNNAVDRVAAALPAEQAFERARRETRWHYQWLVLHELLPDVVGKKRVADVLRRGRRHYRPGRASIPVEFAGAAFRFAHSMVRPSYRLNLRGDGGAPFFAMTFDPGENGSADPRDLRGGRRSERCYVDWQSFFDFGDGEVGPSKRIDTRISTPLFRLPAGAIPGGRPPLSLPQRDLLRHLTWQLPSGQAVARKLGVTPLPRNELPELARLGLGLERSTPLWYYVLKEAELLEDGMLLGPVGGTIVAEVIVGLLQLDPESYLRAEPSWRPTFGGADFRMADFLRFAGVDPASRAAA
jgi:hypothetical protein